MIIGSSSSATEGPYNTATFEKLIPGTVKAPMGLFSFLVLEEEKKKRFPDLLQERLIQATDSVPPTSVICWNSTTHGRNTLTSLMGMFFLSFLFFLLPALLKLNLIFCHNRSALEHFDRMNKPGENREWNHERFVTNLSDAEKYMSNFGYDISCFPPLTLCAQEILQWDSGSVSRPPFNRFN